MVKEGGRHAFEPLQAKSFLLTQADLQSYLHRQFLIKDFETFTYGNLQRLSDCKTIIDAAYVRLKEAVELWYQDMKQHLDQVSARMSQCMEVTLAQLQARQYDRFTRPMNTLDKVLLTCHQDRIQEVQPLFIFVKIRDAVDQVIAKIRDGSMIGVEENYELRRETMEHIGAEGLNLQDLRLT